MELISDNHTKEIISASREAMAKQLGCETCKKYNLERQCADDMYGTMLDALPIIHAAYIFAPDNPDIAATDVDNLVEVRGQCPGYEPREIE